MSRVYFIGGCGGLPPEQNLKISCLRLNLLLAKYCLKCIVLMNDSSIKITDCLIRVYQS